MSDSEREQKDREIRDLKQQVAQLNEQLNFLIRQLYGKRSEKGIPDSPDQPQLFEDETQSEDDEDDDTPSSSSTSQKKRKPKKSKKSTFS